MAAAGGGGVSTFDVNAFASKMTKGGALASLFQCTITAGGKSSAGSLNNFQFMCKGVSFPASTIDPATVTYMGRALQIPGNRAAAQLTTSIYNDEDMEIRNYIEGWMEGINSHKSNKRDSSFLKMMGTNTYTAEMSVSQLRKDGSGASKTYNFHNVWPSTCPEIAMSWDTNEIQTFDVVWEYNYWDSGESSTGI